MYALSPPLFELLAKHLQLTNSKLAQQYPAVHYSVLKTLYSHCAALVIRLKDSFLIFNFFNNYFLVMNISFITPIYLNEVIQIM